MPVSGARTARAEETGTAGPAGAATAAGSAVLADAAAVATTTGSSAAGLRRTMLDWPASTSSSISSLFSNSEFNLSMRPSNDAVSADTGVTSGAGTSTPGADAASGAVAGFLISSAMVAPPIRSSAG